MTSPLFIDLETRSACDLRLRGGFNYATDETTRLLTVAWQLDGQDHVWLPGLEFVPGSSFLNPHLPGVMVYVGKTIPAALAAETWRTWIAHNGDMFDAPVWLARQPEHVPAHWRDTLPMCLQVGLPGGLDRIGKMLWGEGKYADGAELIKKHSRATGLADCEPENVPFGALLLIAKYNVQDVRLMADLHPRLVLERRVPPTEDAVLKANVAINARGCKVDRKLVIALHKLAVESKAHAVTQIKKLTEDDEVKLETVHDIQSRNKVFAWLSSVGVNIGDSLRKNIVARFITTHSGEEDQDEDERDEDGESDGPKNLAKTVKVLELRMQALRITEGKLDTALWSLSAADMAFGLFAYWGAHTGRWAGRRIQVQNLPRPKDGVDTWKLIDLFERTGELNYDDVAQLLPIGNPLYRFLSVDDGASALLRSIFVARKQEKVAAADLASIEARVLARLAREEWLLQAFWDNKDQYITTAEKICGPKETWAGVVDGAYKKHANRQIGKIGDLACGYQGGKVTVGVFAASMGFNLEDIGTTAEEVVTNWRKAHPAIAGEYAGKSRDGTRDVFTGGLWGNLRDAAILAVERGAPVKVGDWGVEFGMRNGHLRIRLPSGRELVYRTALLQEIDPPWKLRPGQPKPKTVVFTHPRYGRKYLYGGLLAENIVQAISRDILAASLARLEELGIGACLHCHDEGVSSIHDSRFGDFMRAMTTGPEWLGDFPLDAMGCLMPRYAKDPPPGQKDELWRNGRTFR